MTTKKATIYHNPRCSKSRQTLALLQEHGVTTEVVEYLQTPPDTATLAKLGEMLSLAPREFMRHKEDAYRDNNLADNSLSDAELRQAIVDHPILLERPIVVCNGRAAIGRPPESVLELL